ncbi:MAG: hypothetical protein B7Y61_21140 [Rhizobiales bacterium 35-66-30]|nr:MAG: hypothetical protein B7Y61_21140 [Rhizobiales bacterium 35-66-30]
MGTDPGNGAPYSVELCGGTHVSRTGDIGIVSIVSEGAVASGVRRLEALTATTARHHLNAANAALQSASASLKTVPADLDARITALVDERRKLERDLADARKRLAMGGAGGEEPLRTVGDVKLMAKQVSGIELKDLKSLVDEGKKRLGSGVVAIVGVTDDGKAGLVVGVTADLVARFDAQKLVRAGVEALGGKGGGGRGCSPGCDRKRPGGLRAFWGFVAVGNEAAWAKGRGLWKVSGFGVGVRAWKPALARGGFAPGLACVVCAIGGRRRLVSSALAYVPWRTGAAGKRCVIHSAVRRGAA